MEERRYRQNPEYPGPYRRRNDSAPRGGNGLSVSGPGGMQLTATGPLVTLMVILAAGFGSLGYIMHESAKAHVLDHQQRMAEHLAILNAQNELACVFTLPQEARPAALSDPQGICHYVRTVYYPERRRP